MKTEKERLQAKLKEIERHEKNEIIRLHYPEFKKYEGRYFKNKNSYGGSSKTWYYYTKVVSIKPEYVYDTKGNGVASHFDGYRFEYYDGSISIERVERRYIHSLEKEITEKEFNKAWGKIIEKINTFL